MNKDLEIAYDEVIACLAIKYPRSFEENVFIDDLKKNPLVNGFIIEGILEGLEIRNFIKREMSDENGKWTKYIRLTPEGMAFMSFEGYVKQSEIYENNLKSLELSEKSFSNSEEALKIAKDNKTDQKVNTRWVKIAAWTAIALLLISHDLRELLQKLWHLLLYK